MKKLLLLTCLAISVPMRPMAPKLTAKNVAIGTTIGLVAAMGTLGAAYNNSPTVANYIDSTAPLVRDQLGLWALKGLNLVGTACKAVEPAMRQGASYVARGISSVSEKPVVAATEFVAGIPTAAAGMAREGITLAEKGCLSLIRGSGRALQNNKLALIALPTAALAAHTFDPYNPRDRTWYARRYAYLVTAFALLGINYGYLDYGSSASSAAPSAGGETAATVAQQAATNAARQAAEEVARLNAATAADRIAADMINIRAGEEAARQAAEGVARANAVAAEAAQKAAAFEGKFKNFQARQAAENQFGAQLQKGARWVGGKAAEGANKLAPYVTDAIKTGKTPAIESLD